MTMINHPNRRRKEKVSAIARSDADHDHDYTALLNSMRASFAAIVASGAKLFQTDAVGLNGLYLDALPSHRQIHNCSCCRHFIDRFGGLVTIAEDGDMTPVMWPDAPEFYQPAFDAIRARVRKARVTSVFLSKESTWGVPATGSWSHMAVASPSVYSERALTAGQAMAAAKENFRTVATALTEFTAPMLDEALRMFKADALDRSERFIGPVKWLRALHDRPKGKRGENVLWRAIASAPEGYCHPKASVVGPLLEDIATGLPFEEIKAKFSAMLHPLQYQRPQAAPSAGNIKAAEELVAKLGIARSLERRFARLDEIETFWKPAAAVAAKSEGVFGHIRPKGSVVAAVDLPTVTMTWDKFTRTVLPDVLEMQFYVPHHGNFTAMLTAVYADAPPILKWDNPVSSYVYHNGSSAESWALALGWANVTALALRSNQWGDRPKPELGEGVTLVLTGAVDTRTNQGNALFPETMKAELHGARATIEAYSRSAEIGGREQASACGYSIGKEACGVRLRALVSGAWSEYHIDRWD